MRVGLLVRGVALLAGIVALAGEAASPYTGVLSTTALVLPIVLGVLLVLRPLILSILSYRDFFPPLVRSNPTVERGDHVEHYNRGLGYRDRGMWYMVAQEWFAAARMRPGERAYLPALGLAYAQIRKLYPNSRAYTSDIEAFLRGRRAELAAAPELATQLLVDVSATDVTDATDKRLRSGYGAGMVDGGARYLRVADQRQGCLPGLRAALAGAARCAACGRWLPGARVLPRSAITRAPIGAYDRRAWRGVVITGWCFSSRASPQW